MISSYRFLCKFEHVNSAFFGRNSILFRQNLLSSSRDYLSNSYWRAIAHDHSNERASPITDSRSPFTITQTKNSIRVRFGFLSKDWRTIFYSALAYLSITITFMGATDVNQFGVFINSWTIRASMICMVTVLFWLSRNSKETHGSAVLRFTWLLGSLFALAHLMAAMGFYHHWSHANAVAHTAEQTNALLGVAVGGGVYFNYLFVVVWLVDAVWWISFPAKYRSRATWIHWVVYGYLIFIAINGAIVFASGWVRWSGVFAVLVLVIQLFFDRPGKRPGKRPLKRPN